MYFNVAHPEEEIDLENLAYQVRLDDERCRSQQIQDRDRNVLLVIKHPAVALRYQIPTGQIRRIQLNFQPDAGYEVAVRIFRSLGVPVQDKNAAIYGSQDAGSRSVSPRHPHPAQPYPIYSMGTQMNTDQYPTESPTLGTIPSFEMPSAVANMPYDGRLQSPAHGPFDSLGSPSRDLGLGGFSGHLQDPALQERSSTSYSQYFPSASAVQQRLLRPTTAPTTLSQLMPPKRELPFPKAAPELTADPFIEESNRSDTNQGKETGKGAPIETSVVDSQGPPSFQTEEALERTALTPGVQSSSQITRCSNVQRCYT
ncbi:MAG: hypothetical protein L6R35_006192 [Caloplaca aegaea]|nr:MAG: hypothetical protein L6R35_006192 [Caloplaca aegaea]